MAARRALRLAERHVRNLRPIPRPHQRIGQWRVDHGLSPGSSGYGPLRDLPDWSFVDGRPAPLWKGQLRRLQENEELARRAVGLIRALDAAAGRGRPPAAPAPRLRPKGPRTPGSLPGRDLWRPDAWVPSSEGSMGPGRLGPPDAWVPAREGSIGPRCLVCPGRLGPFQGGICGARTPGSPPDAWVTPDTWVPSREGSIGPRCLVCPGCLGPFSGRRDIWGPDAWVPSREGSMRPGRLGPFQ